MTSAMCAAGSASSPDVLQRIAVQHDHIRMSIDARVPGWSSARSRSAATRVAAEFRIRAQVQPPIDTRRPSFMLKLTGFFDRNRTLDVPALGGHCHAKAS
jgi:hypothetical protein